MNDRYDSGYDGDQQYEIVGYDDYGRPIYQQVPPQQAYQQQQQTHQGQQPYDPYAQQTPQNQGYEGYGYDPYTTGQQQPAPAYDQYGAQNPATGYDPYGQAASSGPQPRVAEQTAPSVPTPRTPRAEQTAQVPQQGGPAGNDGPQAQGSTQEQGERDYSTQQFAFVEEPSGDSEDVIDWLNFTENRTERREEAKRRARSRVIALVVVLALVAVGGVGYLWFAGKLPGTSSSDTKAGGTTGGAAQKRDVVVVHLHNTAKGGTSTVLLVDNTTTKQGATVLLPNSLALTDDDGTTTTLAKSVDDDGSSGTRDALDTVLGTDIEGTWRLDTPYLQNLVELVGNIDIDTNADVPDPGAKKGTAPLVKKGEDQTLSGKMAVAYATYVARGETQDAQLERFGQVMQGVLRKLSSDTQAATVTVQTLAQILDPSLTDKDLGSFLARLADLAKGGDYKTTLLPVQGDGTLSAQASSAVVKTVLGGTAKSPDKDAAVRVSVQNATGDKDNTEKARVALLNGGFTFLEAGTGTARATSQVTYTDAADKENATEAAKTLGLPTTSVKKGTATSNADVSVILGQDFKAPA
ncbi:LytR C-terminal domain-containing protein [Streptomyces sp. ME02-8801-2C]|uniref:LytR C-terminal domain-containing protein n=1 Tax=Streptomyces sp. ME02-8801-2C TaxID=3028680 RepID=UPI0029B7189C|nr:LytR C-terminal domain-containing protein [Streptomyces sp. ME02-8801-2C]MDX3453112.1 LytR C-terminal domain-containing protein [Streptomyces sp. ME02-8801-2C]